MMITRMECSSIVVLQTYPYKIVWSCSIYIELIAKNMRRYNSVNKHEFTTLDLISEIAIIKIYSFPRIQFYNKLLNSFSTDQYPFSLNLGYYQTFIYKPTIYVLDKYTGAVIVQFKRYYTTFVYCMLISTRMHARAHTHTHPHTHTKYIHKHTHT